MTIDYAGDYALARGLSIRARKRLSGFAAGEQRSPATGGGIEFADYREYMPGDDVRLLDWAVYLRSRKLLVKLWTMASRASSSSRSASPPCSRGSRCAAGTAPACRPSGTPSSSPYAPSGRN